MNKQAFIALLKNPDNITATDLEGLEEVLEHFPYFQAAHILAAKGSKDQGKMLAEQKLRKAAAYTSERKVLKKLILPPSSPVQKTSIPVTPASGESVPPQNTGSKNSEIATTEAKPATEPAIRSQPFLAAPEEKQEKKTEKDQGTGQPEIIDRGKENQIFPGSDGIFDELHSNLRALRDMRAKLSAGKSLSDEPEAKTGEQELAGQKIIFDLYAGKFQNASGESSVQDESIPEVKTQESLVPEKIKEHNHEEDLFSSRLDEVIVPHPASDRGKAMDEGELLLNYLSYLEEHKKANPAQGKKKTHEIIERFIREDPSIPPMKKDNLPEELEDKASGSYKMKSGLVSENMAKIFLLQGKKEKAIEIYEQLVLKYPEKKPYFEAEIEKIRQK